MEITWKLIMSILKENQTILKPNRFMNKPKKNMITGIFKKGNKKYLRFKTHDDKKKIITLEKRRLGKVPVTSATHSGPVMRYLVSYELTLGNKTKSFKVSLADRRKVKYKLLIGRDFIKTFTK